MTTEEKAKAYDELKVKAQELEEDGCFDKLTLFDLFPELAESEDEKIRKELIEYIKDQQSSFISAPDCRDKYEEEDNNKYNSWISWLEKQSEKGTIGNEKKIPFSEQKPAWSEEDEKMLKDTIRFCELCGNQVSANWLKSLRPQNVCTYNPYKAVVESIAEMCKHYDKTGHDGLRDFYNNVKVKCKDAKEYDSLYPQSQWKPSEEQMEALDDAIDICSKQNNDIGDWLDNLREQLNKLKEA